MSRKTDTDDEALITLVAAGDQRAFNLLVQRYSPGLYRIVHNCLGSNEDADEIVQEAFWRFWKNASKWRYGEAKLSTWLYRVAINRAIDHLRRSKKRLETGLDEADEPEANEISADVVLEHRQSLAQMKKSIGALPDKQRIALLLSIDQEHSNAEIASILNSTEGAVEQLLVRARRSLRDKYRGLV